MDIEKLVEEFNEMFCYGENRFFLPNSQASKEIKQWLRIAFERYGKQKQIEMMVDILQFAKSQMSELEQKLKELRGDGC